MFGIDPILFAKTFNDYGKQIESFVFSVYYRIIEIIKNKPFPNDINLYPGSIELNKDGNDLIGSL